jgi:hypothetical protein
VALLALGLGALGGPGCSAQGEGERCDHFPGDNPSINGNDECQDGLVCTPAFNIATTGDYDRCCPQDLTMATVAACEPGGTLDGGSPSAGRDASFDVDMSDMTTDMKSPDVKADVKSMDVGAHDATDAHDAHDASDAPSDGASADSG